MTKPERLTLQQVRDLLLVRSAELGTQRALAAELGVSEMYVSLILSGKRMPGPSVLRKLNLRKVTAVTRYERIP